MKVRCIKEGVPSYPCGNLVTFLTSRDVTVQCIMFVLTSFLLFFHSLSLSISRSTLKYPGAKCTWKQRKEQIRKTQNEPQWRDVKVRCIKEGVPSYPYSNFSDMSRWRCDSIMFVLTFFLLFFHSLSFDLSLNSGIPWCKVHLKREERTNQKNSGWTSVDRSTKATQT